jgi:hypothetical protein
MTTLLLGPLGRYPDYARGENQYARINGAQTAVLVSKGGGMIHTVTVGVAGTLAKFYDVKEGGVLDDTTEFATVDLGAPVSPGDTVIIDEDFSAGCTVVVTGGADITVSFRGSQTVNPRTFGTQLDGNDSRPLGTSTDKAMAN